MTDDTRIESEELLESEIQRLMNGMNDVDLLSEEYEDAVELLTKLYKVRNESMNIMTNANLKTNEQVIREKELEDDLGFKIQKLNAELGVEEKKQRNGVITAVITGGAALVGTVAGLIFKEIWNNRGYAFETDGVFTSKTFQDSRYK